MAKKKAEAYNDVTELNWEDIKVPLPGFEKTTHLNLTDPISVILANAWTTLDPELQKEHAVWHWALADDHVTFIFKDGRKIRVKL